MRPLADLHVVSPDTPASEALEVMSREDVNHLPVVATGHVEGVVSRNEIVNLLQTRRTLRAA
jgi:CBS domain-containing protein